MNLTLNYIYILITPRYPWRAKIGISERPKQRRKEIACALDCKVYGLYIPLLWARRFEQALHFCYRRFQYSNMPDHAGKSEWFWTFNLFTCALVGVPMWIVGVEGNWAYFPLVLLFTPLPLDFLISVGLYWYFQFVLVRALAPLVPGAVELGVWFLLKYLNHH